MHGTAHGIAVERGRKRSQEDAGPFLRDHNFRSFTRNSKLGRDLKMLRNWRTGEGAGGTTSGLVTSFPAGKKRKRKSPSRILNIV